jgi:hypothetical protein
VLPVLLGHAARADRGEDLVQAELISGYERQGFDFSSGKVSSRG